MPNLRGVSPVGRGEGGRSYVPRAFSKANQKVEPWVAEGRRCEIRVGVAFDWDSRLGDDYEQSSIPRDVGDRGSGKSRRTRSRHSAGLM